MYGEEFWSGLMGGGEDILSKKDENLFLLCLNCQKDTNPLY